MSPVDPVSLPSVARTSESAAPRRIGPAGGQPPRIDIEQAQEVSAAAVAAAQAHRPARDLTATLFAFIEPAGWQGVFDGMMLDRLASLGDRLAEEAGRGDELAGWGALIIRHELNKHELLRDYLNSTGWR